MFLCDPCHRKAGCTWPLHPLSDGRCEGCGRVATCNDCHSYGTVKAKAK